MNLFQLALILSTVFLLSIGQILFKLAAGTLVLSANGFIPSLFNPKLLLAMLVYGVATVLWIVALKGMPLRIAYPFVALGFFIVPTLSHWFLGEPMNWNTYAGAVIIACGVAVSVYK